VTGQVVDAQSGDAAEGVVVTNRPADTLDERPNSPSVRSDAEGHFSLQFFSVTTRFHRPMLPDTVIRHIIYFSGEGYAPKRVSFDHTRYPYEREKNRYSVDLGRVELHPQYLFRDSSLR
jgi:hypothetical protein